MFGVELGAILSPVKISNNVNPDQTGLLLPICSVSTVYIRVYLSKTYFGKTCI